MKTNGNAGNVVLEMTMSLDGYIAGPNVGREYPLGEGGERLHDWMFAGRSGPEVEAFQEEMFAHVGAVVMGRRTFDLGEEPWGDNPTYHAPCFVVTHHAHPVIPKEGGTSYTFIPDGIESAVAQAKQAAGAKEVKVMGGAGIAQAALRAGLVDEICLHTAPVLLAAGTRLFDNLETPIELQPQEMVAAPDVTHLRFHVLNAARIAQ
jgi:dihydrofolate reductase